MPFQNPIVAGTTLVRSAIRSPNYVHGVSGWTINVDGSAEFNNVTVRGTVIASDFQSSNFVSNTAGFDLNGVTGLIQLNGPVTMGGAADLKIGGVTGSGGQVEIKPTAWAVNTPSVFFAPQQGELASAQISAAQNLGTSSYELAFSSPTAFTAGVGNVQSIMDLVLNSGDGIPGSGVVPNAFFQGAGAAIAGAGAIVGYVEVNSNLQTRLLATGTSSPAAPLLVGNPTGTQLVVHAFGLDAGSNGVLNQPLFLNNNSTQGIVSANMRGLAVGGTNVAMTTTSSTYNAPANTPSSTFTYPPSGEVMVWISGGLGISVATATSFAIVSFEIRDTNASGTVRSAANDNLSTSINGATHGANTSGITPAAAAIVIAGLPTSGTGFIRLMIRSSDNAATATLNRPIVTLLPMP